MHNYSVDEILSTSWDRKIALDLLSEIEAYSGERRAGTEELRKFLAYKGYRELLERLQIARGENKSLQALRAVAHAMREYALERPALAAAAFRSPASDSPEWREAHGRLGFLLNEVLAECGVHGVRAELALGTLRSLVRGFVLHEVVDSFLATFSYNDAFDAAIDIFIAGMMAVNARDEGADAMLGKIDGMGRSAASEIPQRRSAV